MQVRTLSGPVQMHLYRRGGEPISGKDLRAAPGPDGYLREAQAVTYEEMEGKAENESSASIRARVEAGRAIQRERFKGLSIRCNGEMGGGQIRRFCPLNKEESEFMEHIFFSLGISVRMYGKILKVARTAADLDGREQILTKDLSEAVSYVRIRQRY